jgi:hypothetical protein
MAALGGETGLDLLGLALAVSDAEVLSALMPALEDGLLVISEEEVRFRHDRVQQAAYALLSARARRLVHFVLAERLSGHPEYAGVAAQQYLPAADLISGRGRRHDVAELFRATASGLRMINYPVAEQYLAAAIGLCTDTDPALLDRLLIERHRALYTLGRAAEGDELYGELAGRLTPVALAEPAGAQIESLTVRGRAADALALGMDLMSRLGVAMPADDVHIGLDGLRDWAAGLRVEDDLGRPDASEPATVAACLLVTRMMPPAFFSDHAAMVRLIATARQIWTSHGPSAPLVVPLAHVGVASVLFRGDYQTGYRVLRHVEAIGEARGWNSETAAARFLASVTAIHWWEPVEHSVDLAKRAHEQLVHSGDLAFACFTSHTTVPALLDCAPTLSAFQAELARATAFTVKVGNEQNAAIMASFSGFHGSLTGSVPPAAEPDLGGNPMAAAYHHLTRGLAAMVFGDVTALVAHAAGIAENLPYIAGNYFTANAHLMRGMALLSERRFDEVDAIREWLTARAVDAPANFRHLALFLDAERAWAGGDPAAGPTFDAALREVARRQRPWQHALIAERAARFHLATGLDYLGQRLLRDAQGRWRDWGATAKVGAQEKEFPFLRTSRATAFAASIGASTTFASEAVDLMAVVKATRALSSETNLIQLRKRVIEILTTGSGMRRVMAACVRWPGRSPGSFPTRVWSRGTAARSSRSCCPAPARRPPSRSPNGSSGPCTPWASRIRRRRAGW